MQNPEPYHQATRWRWQLALRLGARASVSPGASHCRVVTAILGVPLTSR